MNSTCFGPLYFVLATASMEGLPAPSSQATSPAPAQFVQGNSSVSHPGQRVYEEHCAVCHGSQGDGQGPAARWLYPKPRDFSAGLFKIQSTPAGSQPTDDDLLATITRGMPGSSMPGFGHLTERQRRDVIQYLKRLATYTDEDGVRRNRFEEALARGQPTMPIEVPKEPPATPQSKARGEQLYVSLQCFSCHGETGRGDGPSAPFLIDHWGDPAPPRDFATGRFRGGSDGRDLYLRIATGLAGTPMPPFDDAILDGADRWALVQHLQSMGTSTAKPDEIPLAKNGCIQVRKGLEMPSGPMDPAWNRLPATQLQLESEGEPAGTLLAMIRGLHDGTNLTLLLQWRSPVPNGAPTRVEDFHASALLDRWEWRAVRPVHEAENEVGKGMTRGLWSDGNWHLAFSLMLGTDVPPGSELAPGTTRAFALVVQDDPPHGSEGRRYSQLCRFVLEP